MHQDGLHWKDIVHDACHETMATISSRLMRDIVDLLITVDDDELLPGNSPESGYARESGCGCHAIACY